MTRMEPFSTALALPAGQIAPPAVHTYRRISDLKDFFRDPAAADVEIELGDRIVYEIYEIPARQVNGMLVFGTTIVHPGSIGGEYHMTKGHFHLMKDAAEVFLCLSGRGHIILQSSEGDVDVKAMKERDIVYSPPSWGHRFVNSGGEDFILFTVGQANAGHDYGPILQKGMGAYIIQEDGEPKTIGSPDHIVPR
jgi:glucose-6-phosphate isomerase